MSTQNNKQLNTIHVTHGKLLFGMTHRYLISIPKLRKSVLKQIHVSHIYLHSNYFTNVPEMCKEISIQVPVLNCIDYLVKKINLLYQARVNDKCNLVEKKDKCRAYLMKSIT